MRLLKKLKRKICRAAARLIVRLSRFLAGVAEKLTEAADV